jgi:tetratricopeptide (TPR) repeat protein
MRSILSLVLGFILVCLSSPILAAQTSPAPAPTASKPATPPSDDANAKEAYTFELIQNTVRYEADGKGQRDLVLRARIQSESAVHEFGLLVYNFASSFESLDVLYARVRKPDGTVVETPASDVQELDSAVSREAPMYTDQREKHVAIKSLSVGDILEAHLRWTVHDPIAPGHFWFNHSFFHEGICLQEILELDVPLSLPGKLRNGDLHPVVREENGRRIYRFVSSNLKKPEESKIPAWEKNYRGLNPPDVQLSSFNSWSEVGSWFSSLAQPKIAVTPEIRAKAEELTKGKSTEDEKIHALYDFVSTRFRYIGIDLGLSRYTPHAASDVLTNRYGDCKDKHTLFASLLQSVGVSAYPVLISSSYRIDPSFPTADLFDHVITAIPRGDSFLFLDTTPEVAPFGLLLFNIRDRQALVAPTSGAARLVSTPADPPFSNYERVRIDSSIDEKGTLDAKMRLEERGDSEVALRLVYRATPQNKWQDLTQRIVANMGFAGSVSDVDVVQPEDTSKPFAFSFTYHRTDFPDWKNHRMVLPAPPFFLRDLTEDQKLSKDPLPLGALQDVTYETTVKFPKGFTPVLPSAPDRKYDFAEFAGVYSFEDGVLHGSLHLKTLLHEVPGNERNNFSSFAKAIDEAERRYIFVGGNFPLVMGMAGPNPPGFANAKPEARVSILEKMLASDSDNSALIVRLSQAYIEAGRAADAVALLQESIGHRADVPRHLSFALGRAYLHVPDADKAMDTLKPLLDEKAEPEELNSSAYSLAEAGVHLSEALEYSKRAISDLSSKTMDISSDDAEPSDFALMTALAANWDTLGWIKFRLGDFPASEKYLEAAWQLMQSSEIGEHLVEAYERNGKKEKAAAVCNMALATMASVDLNHKLSEEMERLRPSLKAPAGRLSHSSSDGGMALSDMRTLKVPSPGKLKGNSGTAHFVISFLNSSRVENVVFLDGNEELRNGIASIAAAKFFQPAPDDTPARIIRKATFSCSIYTKECFLVLMPITDAAIRVGFPMQVIPTPSN